MPAEVFAVFDVAFEEDALSTQVAPSVAFVALSVPSVLLAIPCATAAVAFPAVFASSLAGFLLLSAASEAPAGAAALISLGFAGTDVAVLETVNVAAAKVLGIEGTDLWPHHLIESVLVLIMSV